MKITCICPPKGGAARHPDGDEITLREKLPFQGVAAIRWEVAIQQAQDEGASVAEQFGALTELYVLYGVEAWTLVDDKNEPVPVTKAAIRDLLLTSPGAQLIGDAADAKYQSVMLPLLQSGAGSSQPTPTDESTSPKTDDSDSPTPTTPEQNSSPTSSTPPKRSKQSSISTIPTAATVTTTTSLDGDSNSSQSSTSAA